MSDDTSVNFDLVCELPYWAQVAFAADCAERVERLVEEKDLELFQRVIQVARWCAAGLDLKKATTAVGRTSASTCNSPHRNYVVYAHAFAGTYVRNIAHTTIAGGFSDDAYAQAAVVIATAYAEHVLKSGESQWQYQRLLQYKSGLVARPSLPAAQDLKFLLLHRDKDIRLEAVRALAFLPNMNTFDDTHGALR